tara:strand:- start:3074 stop:5650 length:2577 start_codon:yes stop_codon:yes gene_type:complete
MIRESFFVLPVLFTLLSGLHAEESAFETLLSESCLDCHDDASEKGGLSLEPLAFEIDESNAEIWKKCMEQIERGFMPPAKKPQPSDEEREAAVLDLEERLVAYYAKQPRHPAVLRRLNTTEYKFTIRDLLHLDLEIDDPTSSFPADERHHGFATDGEKLVTSSFLLRQYLEAAEKIVGQAVHFEEKPEVGTWDLKPPFDVELNSQQGGELSYYKKTLGIPQPYQSIFARIRGIPEGGYHPVNEMKNGVGKSGWYTIRIQAEAKFRHAIDPERFKPHNSLWDGTEPLRLALFTGTLRGIDPTNRDALKDATHRRQADQRQLAIWDLPDDELVWVECKVWLREDQFLKLGFPNGPSSSNNRLLSYFIDNAKEFLDEEEFAAFEARNGNNGVFRMFESPRIQVHRILVEGPLNESWPPASHRAIFGDEPYASDRAGEVLQQFASKAWRRDAEPAEVELVVEHVRNAEKNGLSAEDAIREGIKAILCSPEFLFREERQDQLSGDELASRLSYFLWASMPDEALRQRAAKGELSDPDVLRTEAMRLLEDPRSEGFVSEFLDGWLHLRKLGSMAPDVRRFAKYYSDKLEPAMRQETRLYFHEILHTNGPLRLFLDSDYTYANKELAEHYKIGAEAVAEAVGKEIEGVDSRLLRADGAGDAPSMRFARVAHQQAGRGGILGQASVLTLTANGVDTSPVIRGVWLLENILGTPPNPPPPGVPAIEPDIRGAKTIRDQLQKHRDNSACRSCHAYIDPPGFALEKFDPIGGWRGHYPIGKKYPPIDSSSTFRGEDFADIVEFKRLLLKREDDFARNFVEKLFIQALGRELAVTDRPHIRKVLATTKPDGYRLRDLILACVESDLFRQK